MPAPNGLSETALTTGAQILIKLGGHMLKTIIKPKAQLRHAVCITWTGKEERPCLHFIIRNTSLVPVFIENVALQYLAPALLRRRPLGTHSLTLIYERQQRGNLLPNPFHFEAQHPLYSGKIFAGKKPLQPEKAIIIRLDMDEWSQIYPLPHPHLLLRGLVAFQNGTVVHTNTLELHNS